MAINFSKKYHAFCPRRVTMAPILSPSRSLKEEIDFLALVNLGFWPEIAAKCSIAFSSASLFVSDSASPIFNTIFSKKGKERSFFKLNSSLSLGTISDLYLAIILAMKLLICIFCNRQGPGDFINSCTLLGCRFLVPFIYIHTRYYDSVFLYQNLIYFSFSALVSACGNLDFVSFFKFIHF